MSEQAPPETELPTMWVRDADTPYPYLINCSDFDSTKHERHEPAARKRTSKAAE